VRGRPTPPLRPTPAPLAADGVTKRFGHTTAVVDLALHVQGGAVLGLVGPNGSGKTTALRLLLGLVRPDAGAIRVAGHPAGSLEARGSVAYVPDEPAGLDELTVDEYVALTRSLYAARAPFDDRAAALLRAFALDAARRTPLGALSHGQRRAVSIVAAAALRRPVLVVDEATAALDPEATAVLRELVRAEAARGAGVLVATQDLHFAEQCCDEVQLLARGRTIALGTVGDLGERYAAGSLEEVYLAALGHGRPERLRDDLDAL
jgi:ABC-2 type transport system ATP-binding protein